MDAIPYNAKIMNDMGIVTALNSDDAEMGRRLNQEAAKGVKYGNMSEEDALKMVTLNPAKLLKLDEQLGSIKQGKDADIVLWSEHPLSIFSKAEQTYVDGICYYDRKEDAAKREEITKERNRIILKMIQAKANGSKTQSPSPAFNHYYHCTDIHLNELKGLNWKVD
jgi:adenine deaminase